MRYKTQKCFVVSLQYMSYDTTKFSIKSLRIPLGASAKALVSKIIGDYRREMKMLQE